jgi:hypothetical protein
MTRPLTGRPGTGVYTRSVTRGSSISPARHFPAAASSIPTTASVEFDARPGPLNEAVKLTMNRWLRVLEREAASAIKNGKIPQDSDPQEIAFTLNAFAIGANCHCRLYHDPRALHRAGRAMATVLAAR